MYTIVIYLSIQGVPLGFCPKAVFGVGVGEKYIGVPYAYQGQPYVVGGGMRKEAYKAGLCIFYWTTSTENQRCLTPLTAYRE